MTYRNVFTCGIVSTHLDRSEISDAPKRSWRQRSDNNRSRIRRPLRKRSLPDKAVATPLTVSDATRHLSMKKILGKKDSQPKTLEAKMTPPRNGITWLKRFYNKRPTTGPV